MKGYERDQNQCEQLYEALEQLIWHKPHLRLGQALHIIIESNEVDLFNIRDEKLIELITDFV